MHIILAMQCNMHAQQPLQFSSLANSHTNAALQDIGIIHAGLSTGCVHGSGHHCHCSGRGCVDKIQMLNPYAYTYSHAMVPNQTYAHSWTYSQLFFLMFYMQLQCLKSSIMKFQEWVKEQVYMSLHYHIINFCVVAVYLDGTVHSSKLNRLHTDSSQAP